MSEKSRKAFLKAIQEYSDYLKLSCFKTECENIFNDAALSEISYEEVVYKLLQKEYDLRVENVKKNRIRLANFPYRKYLEEIRVEELPEDAQNKLNYLSSLAFINEGPNIIFSGNPGTGKTHLAIALGIKECLEGFKVLFTTVAVFINQLKESRTQKTLRAFQNKFEKYDLVILDEFGYISSDKEGAELLFTNLFLRTGRKSTIVTTNLSFDRWSEVFVDPV
jgi:DNA replication protein DnaC